MSKEMTRVHENLGARKIHFSLANVNNSASFKRKMAQKSRFLLIQKQTKKLVNEVANDSAPVSKQDRKKKKTARSRNQSDCRIWRIPPARKRRKSSIVSSI